MSQLLDCPICGRRPDPDDLDDCVYPCDRDEAVWVACCPHSEHGCGMQIFGDSRAEAIAAWNRRAPDINALMLEALIVADQTFAQNGLLACHAARQQIRAAIAAPSPQEQTP